MKKHFILFCMLLLCMRLFPVMANGISPVYTSHDDVKKTATSSDITKASSLSGWYPPELVIYHVDPEYIHFLFTDHSYDDASYSLLRQQEGSETWESVWDFVASDSGSVSSLGDEMLTPGRKYNYSVTVTLQDGSTLTDVATVSAITPLYAPEIAYDNMNLVECGSEIPIRIDYPIEGAYTEIYHAYSESGPWTLFTTTPPFATNIPLDVAPRQTHYFRARATNAARDLFSDWSNVINHHVESDWYDPSFTVTVLPDRTVSIELVHKTYVNALYYIVRNDSGVTITSFETADSAAVFTFNDTTVEPGKVYPYVLFAYQSPILCVGWPGGGDRDPDIAEVVVTIPPDEYTITGFTLVDPVTDQDIGPLTGGAFEAPLQPNIRANVGPSVKSVIFFLNNKRRTDNGPPLFTYFPADNYTGDYEPGVLPPGTYRLEATAYSEKNGKGIKGPTVGMNFQILPSVRIDSLVLIDPVTNVPIRKLDLNDTVDAALNANVRAYASSNAKCVTFFLNNKRRTDNGPPIFTYYALGSGGLSVPGQYFLQATPSTEKNGGGLIGYTYPAKLTVVGPSGIAPLAARSETVEGTVELYPNPIATNSRLLIAAPAMSMVNIQLYDQFGTPVGESINAIVDKDGNYQLPLKELPLNRGAYILSVKVDGVRTIKRLVVE